MARPLRIEYPGAWYHVMNRGLNRRVIYSDKKDYAAFLETLAEACAQFNVGLGAYCFMPNHYHLLIHTPEGNLSRFMRHLNGVYTQRYNRKHKRDGSLFRGRYKAILVEEDSYVLQVIKYIHLNPVKAKLTQSPSDYKWSSHKHFLSTKPQTVPEWMETDYLLGYFSEKAVEAIYHYKQFMRDELDEDVEKFYSKKNQSPILGRPGFVEKIKKKYILGDHKLNLEVKGQRSIRGLAIIDKINQEVCTQYDIVKKDLYKSQRGDENIPRQIALSLSRELSGLTYMELAKEYKSNSYKSIASSVYRFRAILSMDKKLANKYSRLKAHCSQAET